MKTFVIIDLMNMFHRAKYINRGDTWQGIGLCLHITLHSIKQAYEKYNADCVIFATEGKSWRKDIDPLYKNNRTIKKSLLTPKEQEDDKAYMDAFKEFQEFLTTKTNCCVLQHENCEADDLIAAWIQHHPMDNHVIISTDSDFQQLLAPNVSLYDGVNEKTYTISGVFDKNDKPIKDKKTGEVIVPNPQYILFEKIIRGDKSDNVFPSYPGVRKTKILEAFDDHTTKGFTWNNFMMTKWKDHNDTEWLVRDKYEHNRTLIDLTQQPERIKQAMADLIRRVYQEKKNVKMIGVLFLKFCGKYELNMLASSPQPIVNFLTKGV